MIKVLLLDDDIMDVISTQYDIVADDEVEVSVRLLLYASSLCWRLTAACLSMLLFPLQWHLKKDGYAATREFKQLIAQCPPKEGSNKHGDANDIMKEICE